MSTVRLRRPIALLSTALLAVMLIAPTGTLAATPTVAVGSTSPDNDASSASPGTVSIGETVRFQTTLRNDDNSTISQLYLSVFSDATLYSHGTPATYEVRLTRDDNEVNGACGPGTGTVRVSCALRNVKPDESIQATFVLKIPTTYAPGTPLAGQPYAGTTNALGTELVACPVGDGIGYDNLMVAGLPTVPEPATCVLSMWSSNGAPASDGGSSHGDTWNFNDGVGINTDLQDFRGRFVVDQLKVENDQTIGTGNPHATTAYSPTSGIPVTVEDIDCDPAHYDSNATPPTTPPTICSDFSTLMSTGFGEISRVDVNGGVDVLCELPGQTPTPCVLHFTLKLHSSEVSGGTVKGVNHVYPGGSETIVDKCSFTKGSSTPSRVPCLTVKKLPGGSFQVDVWTLHNGGLRGF